MTKKIPPWILIICCAMCTLGLYVGYSLYTNPGKYITDVDFTLSGSRYLANMWAARQVTLASLLGFAAVRRSIPWLQMSLGAYSLMNIQDAVIGFQKSDQGLMIGATIFTIGPALMVGVLSRIKT